MCEKEMHGDAKFCSKCHYNMELHQRLSAQGPGQPDKFKCPDLPAIPPPSHPGEGATGWRQGVATAEDPTPEKLTQVREAFKDAMTGPHPHPVILDKANETQVGGNHYRRKGAIQHWDFAAAQNLDYFQGQVTKYVCRWKDKNGLEDLYKARHFLQKYIEVEEAKAKESGTTTR